jgi:tRNA (guanine37-N1)-methyltransferase
MMRFKVLTLFPELYHPFLEEGIIARAVARGLLDVSLHQLRRFARTSSTPNNLRENVDDYLFGGGAGMLLKPEVLDRALRSITRRGDFTVALTPAGYRLDRELVCRLAEKPSLILLSGRYEGFDGRVLDTRADLRVSVGDFVAMGGDAPAMMLIEAVIRRQESVLGSSESIAAESFEDVLLEGDQYTRPAVFNGVAVPPVLRSGNHQAVDAWRRYSGLKSTLKYRPDLLEQAVLDGTDREYLKQIYKELYCERD